MATYPDLIKNIFLSKDKGKDLGFFSVCLSKSGILSEMIVDDYLPVTRGNYEMCKSESGNAALWPMLLEKAYAKLYGCYANIGIEGFTGNVINDFTGAPYNEYTLSDLPERELEELVRRAFKKDELITVSDADTLVQFAVTGINGDDIEIRHPRGDAGEFPGGIRSSGKGKARVAISDLKSVFESITIVHYSSSSTLSKMPVPKKEACLHKVSVFQLAPDTNGTYYVSWHRSDNRCLIGSKSSSVNLYGADQGIITNKEMSSVSIFKLGSGNQPMLLKGNSSSQRDNCVEIELEAGAKYIVYVRDRE